MIRIQTEDFDIGSEYSFLAQGHQSGAIVTFIGRVRDFSATTTGTEAQSFFLEHYPKMTEKVLHKIEQQARDRWALHSVTIIHRIGSLASGDQIVFVGVSSEHRAEAFSACEFIMDFLKTEAPFWKREGGHWVDAKACDTEAKNRWDDHAVEKSS